MTSFRTIAAAVDAMAVKSPQRLALISPFQGHSWTFGDLSEKSNSLAIWLRRYGYSQSNKGSLVSDLPNISENLVLQLACNRLGVGYATAKSLEQMAQFAAVQGAVSSTGTGFLAETNLPLPFLSGEFVQELIHSGGSSSSNDEKVLPEPEGFLTMEDRDDDPDSSLIDTGDLDSPHGFYNTTTPYTNRQALQHGVEAATELAMTPDDVVCVAITLCHPFGIGSAICSALTTGATLVLPAVGGIQGCGVPSERAAATLETLQEQKCSLLFCDTHTLKALPSSSSSSCSLPHLRGGVCKTGSGSTFLTETRELGGATLRTIGKPSAVL